MTFLRQNDNLYHQRKALPPFRPICQEILFLGTCSPVCLFPSQALRAKQEHYFWIHYILVHLFEENLIENDLQKTEIVMETGRGQNSFEFSGTIKSRGFMRSPHEVNTK